MASNSEIEKLERRWLENPLGLTFASLAEAYRKTGDHAKGLEILDLGLAQHPNYVPAHIVRGRCHLDAGDLAEAEVAFGRVIELDPENPIALKSLADLAESEGRLPEAVGRLEALLEVDRNNEEARGQLDRVRELLSAPAPTVAAGAEPLADATGRMAPSPDLQLPSEGARLSSSTEPFPDFVLQAEVTDTALPEADAARGQEMIPGPDPLAAQGLNVFEVKNESEADLEVEPVTEPEPLPASASPEPETEFTAALDEPSAFDLEPTFEAEAFFHAESNPEASPEAPPVFDFELEAELPRELDAEPSLAPESGSFEAHVVAGVPETSTEPELEAEPEAAPEPEPVSASEPSGSEAEPELVVTETMAEIFLRQGHRELALAVYSQLAQRDPANTRAAEAAAGLRAKLEPPAPPEPVPPPAPEPKRFDAAATGGTSVAALFAALLKAERPVSSPAIHPPAFESQRRNYGEPTRPADDSLSLSAVFGEDAPLTAPAGAPADVNASEPSFEQFFSPAESAADAELPKAPEDAPVMSSMAAEDLEQFNAWLRGLKR
jgi:tetratricopeptide (TPR) repeat protein